MKESVFDSRTVVQKEHLQHCCFRVLGQQLGHFNKGVLKWCWFQNSSSRRSDRMFRTVGVRAIGPSARHSGRPIEFESVRVLDYTTVVTASVLVLDQKLRHSNESNVDPQMVLEQQRGYLEQGLVLDKQFSSYVSTFQSGFWFQRRISDIPRGGFNRCWFQNGRSDTSETERLKWVIVLESQLGHSNGMSDGVSVPGQVLERVLVLEQWLRHSNRAFRAGSGLRRCV